MAIKINDIPPEGLTLELADKLDLLDQGTVLTAFTAVLNLKPISSGTVHASGRVKAEPELECSRCLTRFKYSIDSEFSIDVSPVAAIGQMPEHELTGGELETEFYEGDELEPAELVKEQLVISMPMVPLHSPDCKGLCQACGADLNKGDCGCGNKVQEDFSPFSKLKDLFKK
jgi:uncharacterized protein